MAIRRRNKTADKITRVYLDLDLDTLEERFGSTEGYIDHLRTLYPGLDYDKVCELLEDDGDRCLVENHPYVDLRNEVLVKHTRGSQKLFRRLSALVKGAASEDAGQSITLMLWQIIEDAGGDWALVGAGAQHPELWAQYTTLSDEAKVRALTSITSEIANKIIQKNGANASAEEEILGKFVSPSP